jgi:hypothetical protein
VEARVADGAAESEGQRETLLGARERLTKLEAELLAQRAAKERSARMALVLSAKLFAERRAAAQAPPPPLPPVQSGLVSSIRPY